MFFRTGSPGSTSFFLREVYLLFMIFLSPFLDVTRISMSIVSFLAQLLSAYRMLSFDL